MIIEALRRVFWPTLATLIALSILIGLGIWQLKRKAEKEERIAEIQSNLGARPRQLDNVLAKVGVEESGVSSEYLPANGIGRFDHAREIHVYTYLGAPRGPLGGPGYLVFTPFTLEPGPLDLPGGPRTVFVNRGFVPLDRKDPTTRREGQIEGPVELTGLVRMPERRNWFDAADDPARNIWMVRDTDAWRRHLGLTSAHGIIIDATLPVPPGGLPQPGETRVQLPNRHLEYAFTWFALAVALLGVWAVFVGGRLSPARRDGMAGT